MHRNYRKLGGAPAIIKALFLVVVRADWPFTLYNIVAGAPFII